MENADEALHNPEGVKVSAIVYGGRDSDISVPIYQSFNWSNGVFVGAVLESETTSATLGQAGVRKGERDRLRALPQRQGRTKQGRLEKSGAHELHRLS